MKTSSVSRGWVWFGLAVYLGCSGGSGKAPSASGGSPEEEETGGTTGTGGAKGGGGGAAGKGGAAGGGSGGTAGSGGGAGAGGAGGAGGAVAMVRTKIITLDTTATGAGIMGDVPKYPVGINLGAANFDFASAKDGGADLRFTTIDGMPLPHAVESWDSAGKVAAVWVKVDVKGNSQQAIKMTWGDPSLQDSGDSKKVFDIAEGWAGVWHLAEPGSMAAGAYKDATANAADASQKAASLAGSAPGRIGPALSLASGMRQYLQVDGGVDKNKVFDMPNKMTYSLWVSPKSHTVEYQCMFSKGEGGFRIHFYGSNTWSENRGRHIVEICAEGTASNDMCPVKPGTGTDVALDKWSLITGVHDHPRLILYVNGVQEATLSINEVWKSDATRPVSIGNNSSSLGRAFDGLLDEARILNVPKDANWVKLDYESQKEDSKFLTFADAPK